jgi:uncharacterized membrane protein
MNLITPRLRARSIVAIAAVLGLVAAAAATASPNGVANASSLYSFQSITNPADPSFDQLLGINTSGIISGYYGSGANAKHPNKGFLVFSANMGEFTNENYPGAVQTQVVAIANDGNTAGFWVDAKGNNHGFVDWNGVFSTVDDPLAAGKVKTVQVLGLNNKGVAVGFYNDAQGNPHAFKYNIMTRTFTTLTPPTSDSAVATGINSSDEITGFLTRGKVTSSFLVSHAHYSEFQAPGSTNTQAFGLNDVDEIVGSYVDAAGKTHGFSASNASTHATFKTIDDPLGIGNTILNGINNKGQIVGFFTNKAMATIGFVATP